MKQNNYQRKPASPAPKSRRHAPCEQDTQTAPMQQLLNKLRTHQIELELQNKELLRTQQALELSRARYFDLYEQAPVGYLTLNEHGLILEANLTAAQLLGVSRSQLIKQRLAHFIAREDQDGYYTRIRQLIATGEPQEHELQIVKPDGTRFWVSIQTNLTQDEQGVALYRVILTEITARKHTQDALRESEKRYRILFEQSPDAMFILDLQGRHLDANPRATAMLGYTHTELLGLSLKQVSAQVPQSEQIIQRLLRGEQIPTYERIFRKKNGELFPVELTVDLIRDLHGNPKYIQSIARDITERKRAEDALRESEANLNRAQAVAHIGSWYNQLATNQVTWSAETYRIFGIPIGTPMNFDIFTQTIHPDDRAPLRESWQYAVTHHTPFDFEHRILVGNEIRWVREQAEIEYTADGAPLCGIGTVQDITERKQAKKDLEIALTKYKTLFDIFPLGITVSDKQGNVIETNRFAEKLLGVSTTEHLQREIDGPQWQIIRLDGTPMPASEYASVRALTENRLIENIEMGIQSPRETTWLNVTAAPIPLEAYGVVVVYGDIGERLHTAHALRESEMRYRLLADASSDVIWTCGLDFTLTYISPAVERLTGFTPQQAFTQSFASALTPASIERAHSLFANAIEQLEHKSAQELAMWSNIAELEMRCKDGSTIWTETRINFILDVRGMPRAILGITRDITERKRMETERANQHRAQELATLYETTRDLSPILDLPVLLDMILHRVLYLVSATTCAIYLYDSERQVFELRAQHGTLVHLTTQDWSEPSKSCLLADQSRIARVPLMYGNELFGVLFVGDPLDDGTVLPQATLHLLTLFAGQAAAALRNIRMFEHIRVSRERAQVLAQQLLNAQETERRTMARELHDEIGQALTSVQLGLQNIEPYLSNSDAQDALEETMQVVERVLDQTRDLSRTLRPAMLDDFGLVAALRWYVERQAKRAGLHAEFYADAFPERLPEHVETVCFRIAQEAITNIVRHARANHVTVELRGHADMLEFTVRDNGIGFDLAHAMKDSLNGESIGLLGIKERAALIGGEVGFLTAPGQGTEIHVHLPLTPDPTLLERRQAQRGVE